MSKSIRFGALSLPASSAREHFLVLGTTGSGKTLILRMLMDSIFGSGIAKRGLVYDAKRDFIPVLMNLVGKERVHIMNPLDARCSAWDIAADIRTPIEATQFTHVLVPSATYQSDSGEFFSAAVRDIFIAVLLTLMQCTADGGVWRFRDALLAVLYPAYLERILDIDRTRDGKSAPWNARCRDLYLSKATDPRTRSNIMASVQARFSPFQGIGASWDAALECGDPARRISLADWVESDQLLVLGNDESARSTIDLVNRALFQRAAELLLSKQPQTPDAIAEGGNGTWVILDEAKEAGRLEALARLMTKGGGYGVTCAIAFQDIEGFRHCYGAELANEIAGQCGNIAVLRLHSSATAQWAADLFGHYRFDRVQQSFGLDKGTPKMNFSVSPEVRQNVLPSELLFLERPSPATGLTAMYKHAGLEPEENILKTVDWRRGVEPFLPEDSGDSPFEPRDDFDSYFLKPWDQRDWDRLGFPGRPPSFEKGRDFLGDSL